MTAQDSTQPAGEPLRSVVIVGGGSSGWMTAAALTKSFGKRLEVTLIESEEIGIIGVGESTVPHLRDFNRLLEIDEADFIRRTKGTFKLGIQFNDWRRIGDSYVHGFGTIGRSLGLLDFHQYWLKARKLGWARDIGQYSINTLAAPQGRFLPPPADAPPNTPLADIVYAYQFDAALYARYLRGFAEARGARRIEGKVVEVRQNGASGFVESLRLESGASVAGDLFIDCSGFRALLIGGTLHSPFQDWTHWLPLDRAIAVPCEKVGPPTPYTRVTARSAGWQWRIPLQHRTGNGHVYSSRFMSDDEAQAFLLANLDGKPLADPGKPIRFAAGKRTKMWDKNVVAIGLAGGFLEPLESTAIFLSQSGISRLIQLFPRLGFDPVLERTYNAQAQFEFERIRDFLILHYCATERDDTELWRYCRNMDIPDSLREYISLFADAGRFFRNGTELFAVTSWVQVMLGQGIVPRSYHPAVDWVSDADLKSFVDAIEKVIAKCVSIMPRHEEFIARHCAAD
ncbi:MAG TPA: tryptophan halogenase family protein [Steroidobacteraceae bacterium]|nr:tryptophan halogenase family protein [Steroidobacteraceae bacterium]